MFSTAWRSVFVLALMAGCASLPEVDVLKATRHFAHTPAVMGKQGLLSPEQAQSVLSRVTAQKKGEYDVLDRHLALEEAIAGTPLSAGNDVTLLHDGPQTYKAMFEAIEQARDHIHLEFYIIEADEMGERFADLLIKKRSQGLGVNIIYDSVGSIDTPRSFFERLREAGIEVLEFNPVNPLQLKDKAWRINHRDHRKILIVDGKLGFIGGINISSVYSNGSSVGSGSPSRKRGKSPGWRDTHIQINGPAVAELQKSFLATWASQKGGPLPQRNWYPQPQVHGKHLARVITSNPEDPAIFVTILSAISHAERSVHLTMAYFVPDRQTLDALIEAARRGVEVKLILPARSDFWAVFHAGRSHYATLLGAGVQIFERQEALLHAKTAVIDGVWSTIGSSNIDLRSFLHNNEVNAVILGNDFANEMEAMFANDLAKSSRIEMKKWARRSLNTRVKEWSARMWAYWL